MRRFVIPLVLIISGAALAQQQRQQKPATASTKPATTQEVKALERADVMNRIGDIPVIGPLDIAQVIQIKLDEGGRITVSSPLESFDGQRLVKFKHPDDSATIDFHPMAASTATNGPRFIQMYRYDFRDPSCVFFHTSVLSHPGYAQIAGSWQLIEGMRDVSIIDTEERLDENGGKTDASCTMRVHAIDDDGNETHKIEFVAPDLRTLQREHPTEVDEYLRPVLRGLGAEGLLDVDPTLAWQVFAADAKADPKAVAEVAAILPRLDAPNFAEREQAAAALRKLGSPAAVAMLQLDRTKLSPEQNSRLEEILAPYQQLDALEAERLGNDPAFLLSVMDSQDPELRRVASARLAKRVGTAIAYDPAAQPEARHASVEALRRNLLPPAATQAVEKRKGA